MHDRLRIGFVTIHAAADEFAYSGSAYAMREAFRRHPNVEVLDIDNLVTASYPLWRIKQAAYWFALGKRYWMNREPAVLDGYAAQVAAKAKAVGPLGVLLSPSSIPLSHYRGPIPSAFWSDATFDLLAEFYPEASNFAAETMRAGNRMEAAALRNCQLAIYSSRWATESAEKTYRIPAAKLETVAYGANIDPSMVPSDADAMISGRLQSPLRLLFMGSHWQRKGGDVAVAAAAYLVSRGRNIAVDIVGCAPPRAVPEFVTVHGYIDKRTPDGRLSLSRLFRQATLLLLPTRADCVPMVIAEAYAHALPVVATDVGGVASAVTDGLTGRLVPLAATAADWAAAVVNVLEPADRYVAASRAAHDLFHSTLNWSSAVDRVVRILQARRFGPDAA